MRADEIHKDMTLVPEKKNNLREGETNKIIITNIIRSMNWINVKKKTHIKIDVQNTGFSNLL